ncbi:hypothetical protein DFJ58DRAFT_717108 [Suillus subalutaceus]|uniref:uncharacterized protein n=1 Tax=Suillus subalutaceus TaxID=48586 RepID=UPI001B87DC32|nr:uncharacterized protein DFJ58DRAFT_717108 [Suillus subalutaceus]KAG1848058.1 hypothetical protein DFJ58DRAFT_717108 [Suillus subalutaceus]
MNGKSAELDALYYALTEFKPHSVIDIATLIGAMEVALGEIYTGVFTAGGKPTSSCTAALFLKAFVDGIEAKDGQEPFFTRPMPYQEKGMTGCPVRALVEFVRCLSSQG